MKRKPDFIILGAAKSGTTTLYRYLTRHPSIFMSTPKEPSYFAFDERYERGEDWYLSLFADAKEGQLCGEASTNYTNWPRYAHAAERMHALLPDTKFIYLMRHPVKRAYSHYIQLINNIRTDNPDFGYTDTFEQHIEKDDSVIQSSNYILQIKQYLKYYPSDRFLFLFFEEFIRDPKTALVRVTRFLGVNTDVGLVVDSALKENLNKDKEAWLIRSRLTAPLKALPGAQWVADRLSQEWRDRLYGLIRQLPARKKIEAQFIPPPMKPETYSQLLAHFRGPTRELATFLAKDLSHWDQ